MSQETISHQGDTTNNAKFFQKRFIFGKVFGRLTIKLKNVRKKNNKSKRRLEEINNRKTNPTFCNDNSDIGEDQQSRLTIASSSTLASSSSVTPLPDISDISVSQPVALASVTSFSDDDPTLTADSSSKSASLLNDGSILRHKTSAISEAFTITSSEDLEAPKLLKKNSRFSKKLFIFSKRKSIGDLRNNNSIITINSNEGSSCEDSAYETEPELETSCLKKKENKKISQKIQEDKIIKKTKLTTLSSKDKEYIEIQKFFKVGLKNKKIHGIVRLQMPTKIVDAHEQFKKQVAQANNLSESKVCHRMFHGTKTAMFCKPQHFVNNKIALFCKLGCGVCGIIQEGNRTKYSHYTQRMWFANNSATSLSYCSSSKVKAMFVVDVIAASPSSILIIDKDEATIPRYLIIFQ